MRLINVDQAADKLGRTAKILKDNGLQREAGTMFAASIVIMDETYVPLVDAAPVVHGHWVFHPKMYEPPTCSECGVKPKTPGYLPTKESYKAWFKYCPHCGAKLDGGDEDEG